MLQPNNRCAARPRPAHRHRSGLHWPRASGPMRGRSPRRLRRPQPAVTVLHCGHLLDTVAGKLLGRDHDRGRRQARARGEQRHEPRLPGAIEIDLGDQTCLPGLIDSHTHLTSQTSPSQYVDQFRWNIADYAVRSTVYARRTLLAGFTTVRNVGRPRQRVGGPAQRHQCGIAAGPAHLHRRRAPSDRPEVTPIRPTATGRTSRAIPDRTIGIINSPDDAVKAVREHYKVGDDLIKIMPSGGVLDESASGDNAQLTLEEIRAVVATAHDYGFTVAAHAHGAEAIRRAVLGGVDSIEHGTYMDAEDMKLMVEHGTWYVPTIIAGDFVARQSKVPGYYPPQVAAKAAAIGPLILGDRGPRLQGARQDRVRHRRRGLSARPERP